MENNRGLKAMIVAALLISLTGIGVAFAAMSQDLTITGQAELNPAQWDIHFENLALKDTVGDATEITSPIISSDIAKITGLNARFTKPGDEISYVFDVVNAGSINAELDSLNLASSKACVGDATGADKIADEDLVCNNLYIRLEYVDGSGTVTGTVTATDTLPHTVTASRKKMMLTIGFDELVDELPTDRVQVNALNILLSYVQA